MVLKLGKSQAKGDELVTLGQLLDGLRAECHTRQWRYREGGLGYKCLCHPVEYPGLDHLAAEQNSKNKKTQAKPLSF